MHSNPPGDPSGARVARKTRVRALIFLALAGLAGVFVVVLVGAYLDQVRERTAAEDAATEPVVVATEEIAIGEVLGEDHLRAIPWPEDHLPPDRFDAVSELEGYSVERALAPGEPILGHHLADPERGQGLASLLADGTRAMTIRVNQVVGVSGFVQPGDFVDVITTMSPDGEIEEALGTEPDRVSKITLQNIRVLAVGDHLETEGREPVEVTAITLEVLPEEAERLALASQHGNIQLTMRSRTDQTRVATPGITPLGILLTEGSALDDLFAEEREQLLEQQRAREPAPDPRPQRRPRRRASEPEPEEERPVVEILRGTRGVDERTLRQRQSEED